MDPPTVRRSASDPCFGTQAQRLDPLVFTDIRGSAGQHNQFGADQSLPQDSPSDIQALLSNFELETHAWAIQAHLGATTLWPLTLLSYQAIDSSDLRPVVKGFLCSLLFDPSHLKSFLDRRNWTALLTQAPATLSESGNFSEVVGATGSRKESNQGWDDLAAAAEREAEAVDSLSPRNSNSENRDLWGGAASSLMELAKLEYTSKNYAGAIKHYSLAVDQYCGMNTSPLPNLLLNRANCHSAMRSWPLALQDAGQALGILLSSNQPIAWTHDPVRLSFLKTKALALKARAEQYLGLDDDKQVTLRRAKRLGLLTRVTAALELLSLGSQAKPSSPCLASAGKAARNMAQKRRRNAKKTREGLQDSLAEA
jgi:hypothetical protein